MRSLIVLGGADGAITTLRAARRIGLHTICVDQRTDAPALRWADEYCGISTRDVDKLIEAFADRDDVAGVISPASDVNLPTQHRMARRLGLPCGISELALRASVDKGFFRDSCDALGQPGPRFVQATPARLDATGLTFPVIVKPTDSSGGRGISVCERPEQLPAALIDAARHSACGVVIAEEYLRGSHHTAEAVVVDGRVALLSVGDRVLTPPPHFVTVEHRMPSATPGLTQRVRALLDEVCRALQYEWGALNVDVLVTPDGRVVLIELGARLGGNGSAELLGLVHGVDVIESSVRLAVGERPALASRRLAHATFRVITAPNRGKLIALHGAEAVRALPGVVDLVVAAQPGDRVEPYGRAGAKIGYVMVTAPTDGEVQASLDAIDKLLHIEVDDGSDQ